MPLTAVQESRAPQTGRRKTATPSRHETNRISSPIKTMCVVGQETQMSLKPNSGCSALENQRRAIILSVSQQVGKTKSVDTLSSPQNSFSTSSKKRQGNATKAGLRINRPEQFHTASRDAPGGTRISLPDGIAQWDGAVHRLRARNVARCFRWR